MNDNLSMNEAQDQSPVLLLLSEVVPKDGCFGHIPDLPGLCFRGEDLAQLEAKAPEQISGYVQWVMAEGLQDLNPTVTMLADLMSRNSFNSIRVVKGETIAGSPVWISGNPAALFDYDLRPLADAGILAYLRFTQQALKRIGDLAEALPKSQREHHPVQEHRSVDEMLTHVGNCVWWYCSRIDDNLAEPDDLAGETPFQRIGRLFDFAIKYLRSIPLPERIIVHTPKRFLTNDPWEQWTHTKSCRRQAEHAWEHLAELTQMTLPEGSSD